QPGASGREKKDDNSSRKDPVLKSKKTRVAPVARIGITMLAMGVVAACAAPGSSSPSSSQSGSSGSALSDVGGSAQSSSSAPSQSVSSGSAPSGSGVSTGSTSGTDETLTVGVLAPMTGFVSGIGSDMQHGWELYWAQHGDTV